MQHKVMPFNNGICYNNVVLLYINNKVIKPERKKVMKQTAKRILSMVLSLLMLVSVMSVYTFATTDNYDPAQKEQEYNDIIYDSVIVNPLWAGITEGSVSFTYRGKTITENYLEGRHFATAQEAYDYLYNNNCTNFPIILADGDHTENLTVKTDIVIYGSNAGINPNVKNENDVTAPWTANTRSAESTIKAYIAVDTLVKTDITVTIDGVKLADGFSYVDAGIKTLKSNVVLKNSVIDNAGVALYRGSNTSSVFTFTSATNSYNSITIKDVRALNMISAGIISSCVDTIDIDGLFYTASSMPALNAADGNKAHNPEYTIKNSMFYNNNCANGVISVDHSNTDTLDRTESKLNISNCVFADGDATNFAALTDKSPIQYKVLSTKNKVDITNCYFIGKGDYNASALGFVYAYDAHTNALNKSIKFNSNRLYGYSNLPDTTNMLYSSLVDFSGNYFADCNGVQTAPVFPNRYSHQNIILDNYYFDEAMTVNSDAFNITSTSIPNAIIDDESATIKASLDSSSVFNVEIKTSNDDVEYKLYDSSFSKEITKITASSLVSGVSGNVFYAVGISKANASYTKTYKVVLSTYIPAQTEEFNTPNTYMLTTQVKGLADGTVYYNTWDNVAYKFVVGKNVFSDVNDIFEVCDSIPTIIFPAGIYDENIILPGSAILLGAKHGVNPNIPEFDQEPNVPWEINPERTEYEEETIIQNAVISLSVNAVNATVMLDGFTFGVFSNYVDKGEGLTTYSTTILKNIIIDDAGGGTWEDGGKPEVISSTIFSFAGGTSNYSNNHKDVRLVNIRMENQGQHFLVGDYFETFVMDGVYLNNNVNKLSRGEWTSSTGQNFLCEMRNNCFQNNARPTSLNEVYFVFNHTATNNAARAYSKVVLDNNMMYNNTYSNLGVFGIKWYGAKDTLVLTNNTLEGPRAYRIIAGGITYFAGRCGYKDTEADKRLTAEMVNIDMKYNRFIQCDESIDIGVCHPDFKIDYSYNYYAADWSKRATAKDITPRSGQKDRVISTNYYTDWGLTTLKNAEEDTDFAKELEYEFKTSAVVNESAKTITDTVVAGTTSYDFGINLITKQANYGVYLDEECTKLVAEPVTLGSEVNTYYIKFSSFDGDTKTVKYKATINKSLLSEANVVKFGNWRIDGDTIDACVPVGTTKFTIPEIIVSTGASYSVFNDKACSSFFLSNEIIGISEYPTTKYIKVVAEDGTTKVYSLNVRQSENDQSELVYIDGAVNVGSNTFNAQIPANKNSFVVKPEYTEGATLTVYVNNQAVEISDDGTYLIQNIAADKTVNFVVSKGNFVNEYKLNITKETSSTSVSSIFGMVDNSDNGTVFEATVNSSIFKVIPTLENAKATYKVYYDRICTKECNDNEVLLTAEENTAYLKVTSADGKYSSVYTLKIKSTNHAIFQIKNAQSDGTVNYTINAAAGLANYDIEFELVDNTYTSTTYMVYADKDCRVGISRETAISDKVTVPLSAKNNTVYIMLTIKSKDAVLRTDTIKLTINSDRAKTTYSDAANISNWALEQVNYLNDNGYGYFVGDNNKQFNPKSNITRFEVAIVATRVLGINAEAYSSSIIPFKDEIPAYALNYVKACYTLGIMNGVSDTEFNGKATATRQEFAKIIVGTLVKASGSEQDATALYTSKQAEIDAAYNAKGFADDANVSSWAAPFIRLAVVEYGLINGSADNGKICINPKNNITRQEVAVILANYNGYKAN